jgi:hypothetical protein
MIKLLDIITSEQGEIRDISLDLICRKKSFDDLVFECQNLNRFRKISNNLYEKVRALFFLYAIYRFHLPLKKEINYKGLIPFSGYQHLLNRRFEEAIDIFLDISEHEPLSDGICSALAVAYHNLGFQTLADQVRKSVRSVRGNQWMFRIGHPTDHPLRLRPELIQKTPVYGIYPMLKECTPVRMDLTHSAWSDIFFLGMDFPAGARVLNISIDLCIRGNNLVPKPPVEAYFRIIDRPVLRLVSVDLQAEAEITDLDEIFDFAKDYLGLLKAAVIASGIVPPGMEGAGQSLTDLLTQIVMPGHGIELISKVNDIPKGSRLAVSTSLLASLIAVCMRATGQTESITGILTERERRLVAARAILGEWLGGSGGGWQDSGGIWPGMKLIEGVAATKGDPEYGISRGRLLPHHTILTTNEVSQATREKLQKSLVLVHGGMAQDVGPILEMVTEKYLLRSESEWQGRKVAIGYLDQIIAHLKTGNISEIGRITQKNFEMPIQTIIPWASNLFTESIIQAVEHQFNDKFYGFWMLGGMAGGGMGFMFNPKDKKNGQDYLQKILIETKNKLEQAVPFAINPVVYDFAINEDGSQGVLLKDGDALLPSAYYTLTIPELLRMERHKLSSMRRKELDLFGAACRDNPSLSGVVQELFEHIIPNMEEPVSERNKLNGLLEAFGFDKVQHEQIRADLRNGHIGLAQNRLPVSSKIEDIQADDIYDASGSFLKRYKQRGIQALKNKEVAVVSLAGGAGSRWTQGAGVVKALNPFFKMAGRHRSFIEIHLSKSRLTNTLYSIQLPHIFTTSYLTHEPIERYLAEERNYNYEGPLYLSPGKFVGLRLIPMERDLRFAWEELHQQLLDEQAQKVLESMRSALISWTKQMGEGSDYTDNLPLQCLHPVGHWYEIPNMFVNGILYKVLQHNKNLKYLMIHNIDTVGANVDPSLLGYHIQKGVTLTTEVITRRIEDRGGGLARFNGRLRLIEGLALPREDIEFELSYYNSSTTWVDIDKLLAIFKLNRTDLQNQQYVIQAVRTLAARMPTYITLKDVKKRWGKGQEDIYPLVQFEKLWGDMTALPEIDTKFVVVPRIRGQQLKEPSQLDGWVRDGSAAHLESLCMWD